MRRLGALAADLARKRRHWERLLASMPAVGEAGVPDADTRLREVTNFGSNPGDLRMFAYTPESLPSAPALVVVLHGCTQTAAGYDRGSGWSTLADRYGFAVLYPEQQAANNPKTCFSWFLPADTTRDRGEALSIRQMIERMVEDHGIDRGRIFVTGLSAGGAMASALLAAYPDVFAAGGIIAGLPHGTAASVQEAFESMFNGRTRPAREWGDLVRAASPHRGPWPRVSIWHGSADTTVVPANAQELVKQWTDIHGLSATEDRRDVVDGHPRRVWHGPSGEVVVEEYTVTGMAHGTPLAPGAGEAPHGAAGPFMLDVGIASSYHLAAFFGLADRAATRRSEPELDSAAQRPDRAVPGPAAAHRPAHRQEAERTGREQPSGLPVDVGAVIKKALRAAGLLRR